MADEVKWFYAEDGRSVGPVSGEQMKELASEGVISYGSLVWREGFQGWQSARSTELIAYFPMIPMGAAPSEPAALTVNSDERREWYYEEDGQKKGPIPEFRFVNLIREGKIGLGTPVWREGLRAWIDVEKSPDLSAYVPLPLQAARGDGRSSYYDILAPRWRRLLAVILDAAALMLVCAVTASTLAGEAARLPIPRREVFSVRIAEAIGVRRPSASELNAAVAGASGCLLVVAINFILLCKNGQTVGKKLAGVRIANRAGQGVSILRILFLRLIPTCILMLIPFAGLIDLLLIFRRDRRTLHDMIAGTIVARAR